VGRDVVVVRCSFLLPNITFRKSILIHWIVKHKAGECTCSRAETENSAVKGETCACGVKPAGMFFLRLS
jgi:hypothetical protein